MWYLILVTLFLVLFFLTTTENFMPLFDPYKKDKLKYVPKEIPYSNFLIDLNNNFKNELDAVQPLSAVGGLNPFPFKQKALCDNKLNIQVQKKALNKAFDKVPSTFPNLLVFEGDQINNVDQEAYINDLQFKKSISDENKFSDNWYNSKIDPNLKIQNNTKIIQDIKFQDVPDFNYSIEKDDDLDPCIYKSNQLSEYTNPRLYLSSDKTRFPPRWIFPPYKKTPLPKTTNLKLWTDMYNCCQNNF